MINVNNVSLLGDYKTLMVEMVAGVEKGKHLLINKLRSGGRKLKNKAALLLALKLKRVNPTIIVRKMKIKMIQMNQKFNSTRVSPSVLIRIRIDNQIPILNPSEEMGMPELMIPITLMMMMFLCLTIECILIRVHYNACLLEGTNHPLVKIFEKNNR